MTGNTTNTNGRAVAWLLGISGTLITALATGSFMLLWTMSNDVSSIAASMGALDTRVDRMDARNATAYDNLDSRLRDVERAER